MQLSWLAALATLGVAIPAHAQTQILIAEGDVLPGGHVVHDVFEVAVDDAGNWLACVDLGPTGPFPTPRALLFNGDVLIGPGDPLPGVPGLTFPGAASLEIAPGGVPSWTAWIGQALQPLNVGAYRGLEPWIVRDQVLSGPGLPAGFTAHYVFQLRATGPDEAYAVVGPSTQGIGTTAIVRIERQSDGSLTYTGVVKTDDVLPAPSPSTVEWFSKQRNAFAANAAGKFAYFATLPDAVCVDHERLFETGDLTPVFGSSFDLQETTPLALDPAGNLAMVAGTTGHGEMLMRNAQVVVRTGDVLADVAPYAIDQLYGGAQHGPVFLTSTGRVVWYARWTAPTPDADHGIFLDYELVVAEGQTVVDGQHIVDLLPPTGSLVRPKWASSADGGQLAARVRLEDGRLAAVRVQPMGSATPLVGCAPSAYTLAVPASADALEPGGAFFANVAPTPPGAATAWLLLSTATLDLAGCGLVVPGVGELLLSLDPAHFLGSITPLLISPTSTLFGLLAIPPSPSLAGLRLFGQALFLDASPAGATLTNGVEIRVGHP